MSGTRSEATPSLKRRAYRREVVHDPQRKNPMLEPRDANTFRRRWTVRATVIEGIASLLRLERSLPFVPGRSCCRSTGQGDPREHSIEVSTSASAWSLGHLGCLDDGVRYEQARPIRRGRSGAVLSVPELSRYALLDRRSRNTGRHRLLREVASDFSGALSGDLD